MSTYSGDSTVTAVKTINLSKDTSSGTDSYTIPANTFAEVQFISCSSTGLGAGGSASCSMNGVVLDSATGVDIGKDWKDYPETMILNTGETVSISLSVFTTGETVSAKFNIIEKNTP